MSSYYPLSRDDIKDLAVFDGQGRQTISGWSVLGIRWHGYVNMVILRRFVVEMF